MYTRVLKSSLATVFGLGVFVIGAQVPRACAQSGSSQSEIRDTEVVSTDDLSATPEEQAGRKIFLQHCSSCHGMNAEGDGPVAASLKIPPANLRLIARRRGGEFPVSEIRNSIDGRQLTAAHGSREMPVWGRAFSDSVGGGSLGEELSGGTIQVLISYLKSIQTE